MSVVTEVAETAANPTGLAVKILIVVAIAGGLVSGGYYEGYKREKLVYDNFVLKEKDAAEQQVIANQAALKVQQAAFDAQVKQIHSEYETNAQNITADRDAAIANAADYSDRLSKYLSSSHVRAGVSVAKGGAAGTVNASSNGLLDGVSSLNWYLTQRFSNADDIANRFNEAVALIAEDRKVCNGSLPGVTPQ